MMLPLFRCFLGMLIGFILAIIIGLILIPVLRKFKFGQTLSVYLEERHASKQGTPTIGGLIFILSTLITIFFMALLNKIELTYSLLIVLLSFIGYALIGFLDDYLIIKRKNNQGLSENQKLFLQLIVAIIPAPRLLDYLQPSCSFDHLKNEPASQRRFVYTEGWDYL